MGKQDRQEQKPLRGRENEFKNSSKSMVTNYETSSTWMKLDYSMGKYAPFHHILPSANSKCSMAPDRGLSDRKQSGVKGKKVRLTYALTSNADGSEKLRPFAIGKAAQPRAFNKKSGAQLGFYYQNNAKAWMTTHLYQD